jgi:hypothetical protein
VYHFAIRRSLRQDPVQLAMSLLSMQLVYWAHDSGGSDAFEQQPTALMIVLKKHERRKSGQVTGLSGFHGIVSQRMRSFERYNERLTYRARNISTQNSRVLSCEQFVARHSSAYFRCLCGFRRESKLRHGELIRRRRFRSFPFHCTGQSGE